MGSMEEKDVIQNRITNLINLRQTMIQALIVLVGGVVGICFMPHSIGKIVAIILGAIGIFFIIRMIFKYKKELAGYLYQNKGDGQ